jgi:outer membrane biosynthesis protein TonB
MAQNKRKGPAQKLAEPADSQLGSLSSEDATQPGVPIPQEFRAVDEGARVEPVQKSRQKSLTSSISDAAAARLLLSAELPADERPRPDDRVLLVGLVWGGSTLIELEQIARGGDLPAGRLFDLPAANLAKNFRIVRHVGDDHVITLPADVTTEVHRAGKVSSLQQLTTEQKARLIEAPFKGYALPIENSDRIAAQVAPQLTLVARYVRAARQRDKSLLDQLDIPFVSTLILALLALGLFFLMVSITPGTEEGSSDDLTRKQQVLTKYQVKPEPKLEQPKFKDLAGVKEGEKAKEKEGKLGKEDAKKKDADPSKKGAPVVDPNKKETDRKKIMKLGLVAALSRMGAGGGSAASNVLGPGGLGSGINNALGGVKGGAGAGDAYGVGGMGTRGTGAGGGGNALGIGGLGTKGGGSGRGGYGAIDLGGRGKDETVFVPGRTTVVGGLSREVINRVIQKHYNEIKYCYEKELTHDPGLYGKITVLFVISGDGRVGDALVQQTTMSSEPVESCMLNHVKRWAFPAPQGGGTVQVTYPYVFKSSGQ